MTNQANTEPTVEQAAGSKSKAAKTKETVSFLSTIVPLVGVLGTGFVWVAANYYVGTVDIKPAADYQDIVVQVFDQKGVEQQFHTPHFLLQPGKYHMAIALDKKPVQHLDTEIKLGATSNIKIAEPMPPVDDGSEASKESRKHWWQIWKKSNPDKVVDKSNSDDSHPDKAGNKSNADNSAPNNGNK